jgi:3-dehydro-L-gulonate 2-dehydrogenase
MDQNINIPVVRMKSEFTRILKKTGFSDLKAEKCADIFAINSLEGVYSHGVNRFPRFVMNIREGFIVPDAEPTLVNGAGSMEQWNGNLGPGPLNASFATGRATELAEKHGIGLVALANTNHWIRGGTYGWQAARKGFIFIGWTNTEANMPAWGAVDARLGNNPFVVAVPFEREAIVLDFAMTQFSYGKMETYKREGRKLPFPGGFNAEGELTDDPGEILNTRRTLPIGNWKGSGFSLLLDILATVISGGLSTHEITKRRVEYSVSQVFIAIYLKRLHNYSSIENTVIQIINDLKSSNRENKNTAIRYPGENIVKIRNQNLTSGIPVNKELWKEIEAL